MKGNPEQGREVNGRLRLVIRGAVQGVGFRPFVYRLAGEAGLGGWVSNTASGVFVEVEGPQEALETFQLRLPREIPPRAAIHSLEATRLDPVGMTDFVIRDSEETGPRTTLVLPDIATCEDCLAEIRDSGNRRYRYPFTNCTNCGPRFSIIEALPYDRPNTTMRRFAMCDACRAEYQDPTNRRFHAQPNACPQCGPRLAWWEERGHADAEVDEALAAAVDALRKGRIVAVKGLGGFHLMADASDEAAVQRLRQRKHREEKPLAVMCPSLEAASRLCEVSPLEEQLLTSPEAPIVLLRQAPEPAIAPSVAPGNPHLGVMLPYTPLHHLLLDAFGGPLVATSGNLSEEPICIDEADARDRLTGIADGFLVHDRPIARHVDDSVVRVLLGREQVLRRARGYAPLPVRMSTAVDGILAVGGHLKNAVGLGVGHDFFVSQHIGDLDTAGSLDAFRRVIDDFGLLYASKPGRIACDEHPDYASTRHARALGPPVTAVQHHFAHIAGCLAENEVLPPALGLSWDGTGYGADGTIWGGEFLLVGEQGTWERMARLRTFRLPGGEAAVKEPRRSALGLLLELGDLADFEMMALPVFDSFTPEELRVLETTTRKGLNAPVTSSMGRLFDAVSALLGLRFRTAFEGQSAMMLEWIAEVSVADAYPFSVLETDAGFKMQGAGSRMQDPRRGIQDAGCRMQDARSSSETAPRIVHHASSPPLIYDWAPTIRALLDDLCSGVSAGTISARFHNTLVDTGLDAARRAGLERVALSGGCFQNALLTERLVQRLRGEGFKPYWHQRVPPNDGGIALGQAAAVAWASA